MRLIKETIIIIIVICAWQMVGHAQNSSSYESSSVMYIEGSVCGIENNYFLLTRALPGTGLDTVFVDEKGYFVKSINVSRPFCTSLLIENPKVNLQFYVEPCTKANIRINLLAKSNNMPEIIYEGDNKDCFEFLRSYNPDKILSSWSVSRLDTITFSEYQSGFKSDIELLKNDLQNSVSNTRFVKSYASKLDNFYRFNLWRFFETKGKEDVNAKQWLLSMKEAEMIDDDVFQWQRLYQKRHPDRSYLQNLKDAFHNQNIIKFFADRYMYDIIRNQLPDMEQQIHEYLTISTDEEKQSEIMRLYEHYKGLTPGAKGIKFTVYDENGSQIHSDNLKGKAVYLDLWATWCPPCCDEIPYMAKLVEHYKNNPNIQIISISLDSNEKAWRAKLAKDKPQWPQYYCKENFNSQLCKEYGINAIPRFLMFDKKGCIISLNAPRPSSEDIINWIDDHIK